MTVAALPQIRLDTPTDQLLNQAKIYEEARAEALSAGDTARYATLSNDLGVAYYVAERRDDARRVLEEARTAFRRTGDVLGQGRAAGNLARLEENSGHMKNAFDLYQEAADFLQRGGASDDTFFTLRALSQAYTKTGHFVLALHAYVRALKAKTKLSAFDQFLLRLFSIPLRIMGLQV